MDDAEQIRWREVSRNRLVRLNRIQRLVRLLREKLAGTLGQDRARRKRIDTDVVAAELPGKAAGEPASVKTRPETASYPVDARVETVEASRRTTVRLTAPAPGKLVVRGQIPVGHKPLVRVHEVEDAASFPDHQL